MGASKLRGPLVTLMGPEMSLPLRRQMSSEPSCADWKMKYLPSLVQSPQQSEDGLLHLDKTGLAVWEPAGSSQSDMVWSMGSMMVKRRSLPSGDHRSQKARPGRVANGVETPSLR